MPTAVTVVVMARDNRVRLSDDELEKVDDAAEARWGEDAAEDVPRGKTIAELADYYRAQNEASADD